MVPSTPDTHDMWKQNYGFNELPRDLKKEIASHNNLMFPGAVKLYKDLTSRIAQPGESLSLSLSIEVFFYELR